MNDDLTKHFAECDCHDSWDQCPCADGGHPKDLSCGCCPRGTGLCGPMVSTFTAAELAARDARVAANTLRQAADALAVDAAEIDGPFPGTWDSGVTDAGAWLRVRAALGTDNQTGDGS